MELKQLRYFVRVVELGSMSRAALDLDLAQSGLSQHISRLESELSTRLLQRSPQGVTPTEAGVAFYREAQLTLRHADQAMRAAQQSRLSGTVSVGLAPTTAAVLGLPLMRAMRERYPDVRLHMVESLSGHLAAMLNARQLDLAVLFDSRIHASHNLQTARRWSVMRLLEEDLFLVASAAHSRADFPATVELAHLANEPLILPTGPHGLRSTLDAAFAQVRVTPQVVLEIDSLAMLMEAVGAGLGATLQPGAAVARFADAGTRFRMARVTVPHVTRQNLLCSLSDDELSPAALATRVVLADCARALVKSNAWVGAALRPRDT
jgi:LysR family transcriptional regulator, regulatory protein for tcuABC